MDRKHDFSDEVELMSRLMTPAEAKFEREKKERPTEWIITPVGVHTYLVKLVHIGPPPSNPTGTYSVPHLRLVK